MNDRRPICVSVINMKGGVGKTTIAAHLCHEARKRNMKVLAVGLDPQANLSQSLMGVEVYEDFVDNKAPSIVELFKGFRPARKGDGSPRKIPKEDVLQNIGLSFEEGSLELIPSRFDFSDMLTTLVRTNEFVLAQFISEHCNDYDMVFIDCAPTESILTRTAYHASRYILIPVKPEFLATIGFPLLRKSLEDFKAQNRASDIEICGVVFNDQSEYMENNEKQESRKQISYRAQKAGWRIYENELPYSRGYPKSLRQGRPLSRTHNPGKAPAGFTKFAEEFFESIGL